MIAWLLANPGPVLLAVIFATLWTIVFTGEDFEDI